MQFKIDKFISNLSKDDDNITLDTFNENFKNTGSVFEAISHDGNFILKM